MGKFEGNITLQAIPNDPVNWLVMEDFSYTSNDGSIYWVKKIIKTDLASTPRIIWNLYPPFGLYDGAAIIHDDLYTRQPWGSSSEAKKKTDGLFLEAMETEGVSWISRHIIYRAVRMFGIFAWNEHTKEKLRNAGQSTSPNLPS